MNEDIPVALRRLVFERAGGRCEYCLLPPMVTEWYRSNETMQEQANLTQLMETLRQQLPLLAERYQVESLGVFGSYVRHEQRSDSDLDVLVTFHDPPSLLKFIELENYLSDVLGVKIDLVMKDGLKPRIGERILKEVVMV